MKKQLMFLGLSAFLFGLSARADAQPRPLPKETPKPHNTTAATTADTGAATHVPAAPQTFAVKYEGGFVGYDKGKGTLNFDDENSRLVFRDEKNKEIFSLPYNSLQLIYPSSKSVRPTAATVASVIPTPFGVGGLAGLIKTKRRYLVVQFEDPDSEVTGLTNFRIADKELLESVLHTLADKAKLKQRGGAFYRPRKTDNETI